MDRTKTKAIKLEDAQRFHHFLQGSLHHDDASMEWRPDMIGKQSMSIIWWLQEVAGIFPDNFEMCRECNRLFDTHHEGVYIGEDDPPGCDESLHGHYCDFHIPTVKQFGHPDAVAEFESLE